MDSTVVGEANNEGEERSASDAGVPTQDSEETHELDSPLGSPAPYAAKLTAAVEAGWLSAKEASGISARYATMEPAAAEAAVDNLVAQKRKKAEQVAAKTKQKQAKKSGDAKAGVGKKGGAGDRGEKGSPGAKKSKAVAVGALVATLGDPVSCPLTDAVRRLP